MKVLLIDALRGVWARRTPTLVALAGLMLAQTACLLAGLLAIALSDPDPAVPAPDRVVMLDFMGNPPGMRSNWFTASPVSFGPMLKERHLPLSLISRSTGGGLDAQRPDGVMVAMGALAVDPDFVPLMGLRAVQGDLQLALARRDGLALTRSALLKLWGDLPPEKAIGRSFTAEGKVYTVLAVIPDPDPRSPDNWYSALGGFDSQLNPLSEEDRHAIFLINGRVYARLAPGASADQVGGWMEAAYKANPLYATLPPEWKVNGREVAFFRALPLTQLPFEGATWDARWVPLLSVAAASALLLLLAAFNTMNLQAATLLQRQRETALRRALGAARGHLLQLWAVESLLPLVAAGAGALLLAWWCAPPLANWLNLNPQLPVADPVPLRALAGLALCTLLLLPLTLALPAGLALRRAPAPALQGRTASEGPWGRRLRQGLLTLQLGGALLLLALTGVLGLQQHHMLGLDRGFETQDRLWVGLHTNPAFVPNLDAFLAALKAQPGVSSFAFSSDRPAADTDGGQKETYASADGHKLLVRITTVSSSFFETLGMKILAGNPQEGSGEGRVVLDAKALRGLGFASPQAAIGAELRGGGEWMKEGNAPRRVVAVLGEVKLESARQAARPQVFLISEKAMWDLTVHGSDLKTLVQVIPQLWKKFGPPLLIDMDSLDAQAANLYAQEATLSWMLAGVALLTVGVAMIGAYALVADTLRRRRTELVLRRLHGAGPADIVATVAREFAGPMLVAALLGLPLAAWLGWRYLLGFVDHVDLAAGLGLPLLAALLATALVTLLAAARHVRLALGLRPVEALA